MPSGIYERTKPIWNKNLTKETDMRVLTLEHFVRVAKCGKKISKAKKGKSPNHKFNCQCGFCKARRGETKGKNNPMYGTSLCGEKSGMYNKNHSKKSKEKMRESTFKRYEEYPETKRKLSKSAKKAYIKYPELKEKLSNMRKLDWQTPSYVKKQMKARNVTPNKTELFLNIFLQKTLPNEYKYVGDGEFILAGKCPDFVNVNGQKKIIELYGNYWHKGETGKDRINLFRQYGYETLIVWEKELKNLEELGSRILTFHELR